jgi:hypothetical protein
MGVTTSTANAGSTMVPIATYTATTTQSQVTFNSIPQTYTGLRLVASVNDSNYYEMLRFNNDTSGSTLYSRTILSGDGSTASSSRSSNANAWYFGSEVNTSTYAFNSVDIMNYSSSSIYKSGIVHQESVTYPYVGLISYLYRSTSPITRIDIYAPTTNSIAIGNTYTLYGIKAA